MTTLSVARMGVAVMVLPFPAMASSLTTLYTFTGGTDGGAPAGALVSTASGIYGTTSYRGEFGDGTVFLLAPPPVGEKNWKLTVLYAFGAHPNDGVRPNGLISDAAGNLYGVTQQGGVVNCVNAEGGAVGCGTVFELSPPAQGQSAWTETILYAFRGGADGYLPAGQPAFDAKGNLDGFATGGGTATGIAYQLSPPSGRAARWTKSTIYNFTDAAHGEFPEAAPLIDKTGAIYSSTIEGGKQAAECGQSTCGLVFKLAPPGSGSGKWTETVLWRFDGVHGDGGDNSLIADAAGNLYGMTGAGGNTAVCNSGNDLLTGCGVVFRLSPRADGKGAWKFTQIWALSGGSDGAFPSDSALVAHGGAFVGTAEGSIAQPAAYGAIDEFIPPAKGATKWTEKTLFKFADDANGALPLSPLVARKKMLYGATEGYIGPAQYGTIFSIKP